MANLQILASRCGRSMDEIKKGKLGGNLEKFSQSLELPQLPSNRHRQTPSRLRPARAQKIRCNEGSGSRLDYSGGEIRAPDSGLVFWPGHVECNGTEQRGDGFSQSASLCGAGACPVCGSRSACARGKPIEEHDVSLLCCGLALAGRRCRITSWRDPA